jgi:tripartite ATP-independent transporter DctM subunit
MSERSAGGSLVVAGADDEPAATRLLERTERVLDLLLEGACLGLLVGTVVVALVQVFYRYVLNASLSWPEELARWAFVWLVFLGMAWGFRRDSHIAIDLIPRLSVAWQRRRALVVRTVIVAAAVALIVHGLDLVDRSSYVSPALRWPFRYLYLAVPSGAVLLVLYAAWRPVEGWRRWSGVLSVLAGVALYYLAHTFGPGAYGGAGPPAVLVAITLFLILLGVPIAFALTFASFAAFSLQGDLLLLTLSQYMTAALDSFILLAIPFFIVAASLMNAGGITERLVTLATRLVGHLRGGLAHANVVTNTMMAGVSGSSMADAAAIAKAMVPEMARRGYDRPFGCALTSASAVLANLIPPSLGLIIYGALASASVGALFVAAIVPGLIMAMTLALVVHLVSLRRGFGRDVERATRGERTAAFWRALPAIALPLLIVGGVRFGVFTATEAGAIAVLYALLCGFLLYRELSLAGLGRAIREALLDIVAVMVIIAAASPFAWIIVSEQIPQQIAATLGAVAQHPAALLLLLNVFLLLVGLIMEMIAAMVILVPIFVPMIAVAGIDPVHFGVVIVINLVIGALTPPLGMLVFTTARVGGANVVDVFRAVTPFVLGLVVALLLITYIPALSLTLPRLIGP